MLVQPAVPSRGAAPAPGSVPAGARDYVAERDRPDKEEPPELRGVVFEQYQDGQSRILRYSGETTPGGPDIPADAVVNDEVLIYVDGIGQNLAEQQRQIRAVLHGGQGTAADLDRPVIGVHEGAGESCVHDAARIGRNIGLTKALQTGLFSTAWIEKVAYRNDPSIKAVKDLVRQSLAAGVQVTLMAHSGGAAQTALALSLLAREESGRFALDIQDKVRVLSIAGASSPRDFTEAGIKPENLLYTGSRRDGVYRIFRNHVHPLAWHKNLPFLFDAAFAGLGYLREDAGVYHSPDYIFHQHQLGSRHRLEDFLLGGPGGSYELA